MSLSAFIRHQRIAILDEWTKFASGLPCEHPRDLPVLRDHAAAILEIVARDLEQVQSMAQQHQKSHGRGPAAERTSPASLHGAARLSEGFSVNDTMAEYRALRASVLRLWGQAEPAIRHGLAQELTRFNEAIDQALTESLARYSRDKDRQARLFDAVLSSSPDLHYIFGQDARLIYANRALATLRDQAASALVGRQLEQLFPDAPPELAQHFKDAAGSGATPRGEMQLVPAQGDCLQFEYLFVPVRDESGKIEAIAGTARDITERKKAEETIRRSATFDALTGLPNRSLFHDRLDQEVRRSARGRVSIALLYIDLDGFKDVNDRLGHAAGDQLLQQAARRIQDCVRDSDTVARLGGDEFTVILGEVRKTSHLEILAQQILDQLAAPFMLLQQPVHISASVGITLCPQDASNADELVRNADQAMYVAKHAGRNRFSFFTPAMRDAAWARLKVIDELRLALPLHQLGVLYQPIVALDSGRVVAAQAALRWHHPRSGLMAPAQFLGLAEETGLIADIGAWVIGEAAACARKWSAARGAPFQVITHKSNAELDNKTPVRAWSRHLSALGEARHDVAVGIGEEVLLSGDVHVAEKLASLQQLGIPLVIDHFGTGLASLTLLRKFNIASIKLDQSLLHAGPEQASLLESIIAMAHQLGVKTVAEGVEQAAQRDWLQAAGCDYAQGFLFAAPLPAPQFDALLATANLRS